LRSGLADGSIRKKPISCDLLDVLTVNAGNGRIVETAPDGRQVSSEFLDTSGSPPGDGALFGLAIAPHGAGIYYVDDAANTLRLLR
jgi:hypothetical protein